jgi:phage shock protein PspC (stress-responsive transcriptional regulator)
MRDRLYRSRDERVLFGVAGGVADWLDIDPALVRIVFALLVLTAGFGLLLYIVMAIVIPQEPEHVVMRAGPGEANGPAAPEGAPGAAPAADPTWVDARAARQAARRAARGGRDGRGVVIFGAILIVLGAWFLVDRYVPDLDGGLLGPIVLIVIGALLLAGAMTRGVGSGGGNPTGRG